MAASRRSDRARDVATMAVLGFALGACTDAESGAEIDAAVAADAFVWSYPLVVSERTMQTLGGGIGANNLFNQTELANTSTKLVVSPNQDTLYSVAVLDVRSEPVVLTVPDVTDRYWTYQFLDAWTDSFHYIGTRATGGMGGTFVIASADWDGALPANAVLVRAPTPQIFLLGRYLVLDEADIANVTALERTLEPLHIVTGEPEPAPPPLGAPPGKATDVGLEGAAFFDELGDALAVNAPASEPDAAALARFAPFGIGPGMRPFEKAKADANDAIVSALQSGVELGLARIDEALSDAAGSWTVHLGIDAFENDPLLRAVIAKSLWGANTPAEAVYASSSTDGTGAPYTGAKQYVLHFEADELPPVEANGFWSLTLYGPDRYFVENAIDRYAIGDRTPGLVYGADGSLDLFIENEPPSGLETNWLPAPTGAFTLVLRLYLPSEAVQAGTYACPPVAAR